MSDAPEIYEALAAVMADVQAVAKRDRNDHQKFMFRGIDAVMNAVGPALRTRGVIVVPNVEDVAYEPVTTSTGKPATACRVRVEYLFYASDGSSIRASVAGEAWDSGDKACPKAMSVAFRTALLQALCLPTDEPDPDTHTYERSTVDLSKLRQAIAASKARDIEGDYDGLTEWAAESQQNADAAVRKLRRAIDDYDDDAEDAATQTGSTYVPPEDEPAGSEAKPSGEGGEGSPSPDINPCETCGPQPRTRPCPDCPGQDPASLAQRAEAHAEGNAEREKARSRILESFSRLHTADHPAYSGLHDRLVDIVGGDPSEVSWDGCSVKRLEALAADAERLVGELEPADA